MIRVDIVQLPAVWQPFLAHNPGHRGDACPGIACLPPDRAVRKLRVAAVDGSVRQVLVFAEHGVERYLPFALFVDELRRQHAAAAAAAATAGPASLYFVPYIVQLPDTNASMRATLHAALHDATLRSVRAHPPAPGRGPNHFIVVPRVCSCASRPARRAQFCGRNNAGLTAAEACARSSREACDPFRDAPPLLRGAVRVLAWEQISPRDLALSAHAGGGGGRRLPNLVVPYPSSVVGPVREGHHARPTPAGAPRRAPPLLRAPWAWTLPATPGRWRWQPRKTVLAFAALGSPTNASRASAAELRRRAGAACSGEAGAAMAVSACAGRSPCTYEGRPPPYALSRTRLTLPSVHCPRLGAAHGRCACMASA